MYEHGIQSFRKLTGPPLCHENLHQAKEFGSILAVNVGNLLNEAVTTFQVPVAMCNELNPTQIADLMLDVGVYSLLECWMILKERIIEFRLKDIVFRRQQSIRITDERLKLILQLRIEAIKKETEQIETPLTVNDSNDSSDQTDSETDDEDNIIQIDSESDQEDGQDGESNKMLTIKELVNEFLSATSRYLNKVMLKRSADEKKKKTRESTTKSEHQPNLKKQKKK